MKVDSHQHSWHYDPVKYSWLDDSMASIQKDFMPMDLEPVLRKNGFEGSILVQADQSEVETEFLLNLAEKHSFVKGVVGWVDLSSDKVGERLKHFSSNPYFKGVRHTVWDQQGEFLAESDFLRGISKLSNFDLAYDLLVFEEQLPGAVKLVEEFPDQRFVLDHMGKPRISAEGPSKKWISSIARLAKNSNVSCKLSGLVTETADFNWAASDFRAYLEIVVSAFGADRLMFGSDWPVCLAAASYEEVVEIQEDYFRSFSEEDKNKIFGGNAARFYRI
ncbi:MAG: amidohydrolase family protein [Salegentibacter sp.]